MALTVDNIKRQLTTDPVRTFKFLVTFTPNTDDSKFDTAAWNKMGFVSVSGLSVSTEPIAYREGGYNTNVHQIPGQSSFTPITLSHGVMLGQNQNQKWMKRLFAMMTPRATAGVGADFRCTLDIAVLSHPNPAGFDVAGSNSGGKTADTDGGQHVSMRFRVYNAWPTTVAYSDLNAGDNALFVEQMTLVHEGFDLNWGSFNAQTKAFEDAPDFS
jgi:phage tail-like protein